MLQTQDVGDSSILGLFYVCMIHTGIICCDVLSNS